MPRARRRVTVGACVRPGPRCDDKLDIRFRSPDALAVLLTLAQTVPLAWRRRAPRVVLAVTGLAVLAHLVIGYLPTWAEFGSLIALYTVAAHCPWRQSAVAAALVAVGLAVYAVTVARRYPAPFEERLQSWAVSYAQFAAAWFLGTVQRRRLDYTAGWRRSPPSWPPSRSRARAGRWPPSGAGSPASCTTWSPTRSA
jgi:hypothetical protein